MSGVQVDEIVQRGSLLADLDRCANGRISLTGCFTSIAKVHTLLVSVRARSTYLAVTCRKCGTAVGRRYVRVPDELQLMAMGFTLSADLLQRQVPQGTTAWTSPLCLCCFQLV